VLHFDSPCRRATFISNVPAAFEVVASEIIGVNKVIAFEIVRVDE
jgi:hypothetical protein